MLINEEETIGQNRKAVADQDSMRYAPDSKAEVGVGDL